MKSENIIQLFPATGDARSLQGLYLAHDLRNRASEGGPFVYSNYVTSLDGRIAIPHPSRPGLTVPAAIANDRDWRLFQELAIQADILFTSGRYLRDYADGRAQEILRVYEGEQFADLATWRSEHGLSPQPDLAVISASLNFPVPEALTTAGRRVWIITVENADKDRVRALQDKAIVLVAGVMKVEGDKLVQSLGDRGYRLMYNATGPKVLHMLLASGRLDRLYLTFANRILGGDPFATIVDGDTLEPPVNFKLDALYLDPLGLDGLGQLFAAYEKA